MRTDPHLFKQGEARQNYEQAEMMTSGHLACPGCGAAASDEARSQISSQTPSWRFRPVAGQ